MKKIQITYNPYLVETTVLVDGKAPKANSALNVGKKRLQEWVDDMPQIILDEYRDSNVTVDFKGIQSDYEDVVSAFDSYKNKIHASCNLHKTKDITDVERTIHNIFTEIQNGPIPELKDKKIADAFHKAENSQFEINVVATMSSGKSTLINALLQKQLMPAANEATTATIVRIVDTEQDNFSAIAFDQQGRELKRINNVSLEDMKSLNNDIKVSTVEIHGKIPFVETTGMKLVLVDTPGPNNSRDKHHEEMTYKMITDSDKSLVLYVMNGQQLGINDEKVFLDYICEKMKEGGKQGRERFIFAANKMDSFSPSKEGTDCIENALEHIKSDLHKRGIENPNIFPVSSLSALELRTDDDEPMVLDRFKRDCKKYDSLHFDEFYNYSNLPQVVKQRINKFLQEADENEIVEIRTGIVSIEQAIAQYINKYARTTKVYDLVLSFNEKLSELSAVAHLEDAIRKDKNAKANLEKQITQIKANIQSAKSAQSRSESIDKIDLTDEVNTRVKKYLEGVRNQLNQMMSGHNNKVLKTTAINQCKQLEKDCNSISIQIGVQIDQILNNSYKETVTQIIEEYKKYLKELNLGVDQGALTLNPAKLVSSSLSNLSSILDDNTNRVNEGGYKTRTKEVFVESTRKWYNPFSWFNEGDHYETRSYKVWVDKYVDYVDMNEVASDYITPFQKSLNKMQESAITHVKSETKRIKDHLKAELSNINKILNEKLDTLSKTEAENSAKSNEIAQKEKNLKWLENIQEQINDIIQF